MPEVRTNELSTYWGNNWPYLRVPEIPNTQNHSRYRYQYNQYTHFRLSVKYTNITVDFWIYPTPGKARSVVAINLLV